MVCGYVSSITALRGRCGGKSLNFPSSDVLQLVEMLPQPSVGVQVTISTVQQHRESVNFLDSHWEEFAPSRSVATAQCGLLWITPEPQLDLLSLPKDEKYGPH